MRVGIPLLWTLTKLTVRDPRAAAEATLKADIGREAAWMILILAGVVSAMIIGLVIWAIPIPPEGYTLPNGVVIEGFEFNALGQGVTSVLSAILITAGLTFVGRWRGGQGDFTRMLSLMAVLELVMVVIQVLMLLVVFALPLLGIPAIIAAVVIFFRGLGHFTQVGHGFATMGQAAGTVAITFLGLFVLLSFIPVPQAG